MGTGRHGDDAFARERIRAAYDEVADRYDEVFGDELDTLALDARLVDRIAADAPDGLLLEAGSGVAPVARRLHDRVVIAYDLAQRMLRHAPAATPAVQGDVTALPFASGSFAAATLRFVLQHLPPDDQPAALAELRRVLVDGGLLLVAVHLGDGHVEFDEMLGRRFETIAGAFHRDDQLRSMLDEAGFDVLDDHVRDPVPGEADTRRLYLVASARTT